MHARSSAQVDRDRTIHLRLTPRSVAPRVLSALRSLGYELFEDLESTDGNGPEPRSGFWLVDEARLAEVPSPDEAPDARILLLSSPRQSRHDDARILAQTPRPARLSSVYAMIQLTVEHNPRRTPRVQTQLSARCIRAEHSAIGAVLSLSEGGCLLRTDGKLRKGTRVDLQFALPDYGLVTTPATCRYTRKGKAGLEFAEPPPNARLSIAHFVTSQLAAAARESGLQPVHPG